MWNLPGIHGDFPASYVGFQRNLKADQIGKRIWSWKKYMATNLHGNGTYPCMKWYIYPYMNRWILNGKCMYVDLYQPSMDGMRITSAKKQHKSTGKESHPLFCKVCLLRSLHLKGPSDMISLLQIISSISKWVNLIPFTSKSPSFFGKTGECCQTRVMACLWYFRSTPHPGCNRHKWRFIEIPY